MTKQGKIIVILGPTASGKSDLAIQIAKQVDGEIISADSRQIYKHLDIGSGKITKAEMQDVPHYLLDIVEPDQHYSLHDWQQNTFEIINKIIKKNKLPIIAGGTGLYLSSILQNYRIPATDKNIREKLKACSLPELVKQLKNNDPVSASVIDIKNKIHVLRALEHSLAFKQSLSTSQGTDECPYDFLVFGIDHDRKILYKKIDYRVVSMIDNGLIDEVKNIYKQYPDKSLVALSGIGYKEILEYLDNKTSKQEAITKIQQNTRRYAKRQMTWFRRMEKQGIKIHWNKSLSSAVEIIKKFIN
jgi:tRNA dimethylallyltransferase